MDDSSLTVKKDGRKTYLEILFGLSKKKKEKNEDRGGSNAFMFNGCFHEMEILVKC